MGLNGMGAGLTLALATAMGCPIFTEASAATTSTPQAMTSTPATKQEPKATPRFVPADFIVPTLIETPDFKLVPLGPALVKVDFDAYMSSIDHLQKSFSRSTAWPHAGISDADAMRDMESEQARFRNRESFAYAVLTPDGRRERGSVYVAPGGIDGYDAVVRLWVTKAEFDASFDAELYQWVVGWMRKDWPFSKIAYPGRSIDWDTWDAAIAASKAGQTAPG